VSLATITRKSLLYRSKVEYGGWTANHVLGCSHGCRYPCYAMTLAKRTGRVTTYEDWLEPRLVSNALELLEGELRRYAGQIDSVHLCFTTDPFMYDTSAGVPLGPIASATMAIIRRLNRDDIPVTVLTKGVFPVELEVEVPELHPDNQFGISLVSLSESYRAEWEPGAAAAELRIASLRRLSAAGARTWISAEPYPTPNIDATAPEIEALLDEVRFVDKIVFGKWNYNRLVTEYDRQHSFYAQLSPQVTDWCQRHQKRLHIKTGTPGATESAGSFLSVPSAVGVSSSLNCTT